MYHYITTIFHVNIF